jgi:hypothetical protein
MTVRFGRHDAPVVVTTEERAALDYLIGPLVASFDQAFRQR